MKFSKLPVGACFRLGKDEAIHKKISTTSYIADSVGPETEMGWSENVRKSGCPIGRQKSVIELGNVKRRKDV
jgi:hypothetical protein